LRNASPPAGSFPRQSAMNSACFCKLNSGTSCVDKVSAR
jgi:hypothetical protein